MIVEKPELESSQTIIHIERTGGNRRKAVSQRRLITYGENLPQ